MAGKLRNFQSALKKVFLKIKKTCRPISFFSNLFILPATLNFYSWCTLSKSQEVKRHMHFQIMIEKIFLLLVDNALATRKTFPSKTLVTIGCNLYCHIPSSMASSILLGVKNYPISSKTINIQE